MAVPTNSVLCAGRLYCDLVFTGAPRLPEMGTETFAEDLSLHAGGGAFITAATFSALGWQASLLAVLPAAPFDTVVCDEIHELGVEISHCEPAESGAAPQLTVAVTGTNDRAFLTHKTGKAMPDIDLSNGDFRHLHIGELRSLVEHPELVSKARLAGLTISVDCAWDSDLLTRGGEMTELLSQVDVFLPNEAEFSQLIESGLSEEVIPLTVIKCGSDGARALQQGSSVVKPTAKVSVVDATGAGDAFNGGFLSGWLSGKQIGDCLLEGNRCGAAAVGQTGGAGGFKELRGEFTGGQLAAAR
ncbi:MAG: PfkB family carbohydrate kinase [Rhizobiaceae bacterium]